MSENKRRYPSPGQALRVMASAVATALVAGACATIPFGNSPTVTMLPGGGKSMAEFNADDVACRETARSQAAKNAPLPAAMGLGSRIDVASTSGGGRSLRDPNESTGSVFGNSTAAEPGTVTAQQRYDTAYVQCMSSKGHMVTVGEATSS